jgi:hypothetical protein
MKTLAACLLVAGLAIPLTANAQKITVKKGDVEVEIDLGDVTALSEAMKTVYIKGKPSLKVAEHFKKWAVNGYSDEGLGEVIKECVDKGYKDEKLVECIVGKTKKKPRPHPAGKAIPKGQTAKAVEKPPAGTPPPKKLTTEADHVGKATGAMSGKKIGGKIKKK